jgi:hypothetical protein
VSERERDGESMDGRRKGILCVLLFILSFLSYLLSRLRFSNFTLLESISVLENSAFPFPYSLSLMSIGIVWSLT